MDTTAWTASPASGPDAAVRVTGLVKSFGRVRALDGLEMTVPAGEVTGFLGPNGAGKSTAIRVLLGLLRADAGTVRVLGADAWDDHVALHRRLAYVPGDTTLWPTLTGGQAIDLLSGLRGDGRTEASRRRRDELLERFDLDPTRRGRTYSKGNRQKVALVAALLADVELYVFDEPTSGLDPLMEAVFQDEVRALRDAGRTVLLSSHILAEVERLCDRVTIIRAGRTVESGTLAELRHLTRSTVSASLPREGSEGHVDWFRAHRGVHDVSVDAGGEDVRVRFDVDQAHLTELLDRLARARVTNLTIAPPSLQDLFMRHYGTAEDPADAPDSGGPRGQAGR